MKQCEKNSNGIPHHKKSKNQTNMKGTTFPEDHLEDKSPTSQPLEQPGRKQPTWWPAWQPCIPCVHCCLHPGLPSTLSQAWVHLPLGERRAVKQEKTACQRNRCCRWIKRERSSATLGAVVTLVIQGNGIGVPSHQCQSTSGWILESWVGQERWVSPGYESKCF